MSDYNQLKNAAILNPTANTDLGSDANRFSNVYMSGNIVMSNGVTVTSTNVITPKIASISYIGDDTATITGGGQVVTLNGTGFASGASVVIGTTPASSVSLVSSNQITFIAPAMSSGTYVLYVINSDGGSATYFAGISYSGTPTWTTSAGSLGNQSTGSSVNITVAATGDVPVRYAVTAGSNLPTGLSLNSTTGVISGTMPTVATNTTYNFTLTASDAQNQDTDRTFSITAVVPLSAIQLLVVAGGGGGGRSAYGFPTGGGGAGGYLSDTAKSITLGTTYTITVGAGSAGGSGIQGANSSVSGSGFTTVTSVGGGGGGDNSNSPGGSGGSGGGGGGNNNNDPGGKGVYPGSTYLSQARQGYDGARQGYTGGGGGGAGAPGTFSTVAGTKTGGDGLQWIDGNYYAGGGGSGGYPVPGTGPAGGLGGGGAGENGTATTNAVNGTANTGGGGGGGGNAAAGRGGSGVVIIRYSDAFGAATSTTGSPTITTTGGYRTYKFTTSGTITF